MAVTGAQAFVPDTTDLGDLAEAAGECHGCELYRDATQTVFGMGRRRSSVMLVGEQPGDREDLAGKPFVGPAGRLLDKALESAGIDRQNTYVTNAVKHFKFVPAERGKRRIHKTPSRTEVVACRPWLIAELTTVEPEVVVLMGATAAKSLMGNDFRLTAHRGEVLHLPGAEDPSTNGLDPFVVVTVHPSAVLRGPAEQRDDALKGLVADLEFAAGLVGTA